MVADDTLKVTPAEAIGASSGQAVNLTKVEVTGADGFSDKFLQKALSPLLDSSDLTVSQLFGGAQTAASFLSGTDCFDDVHFFIEKDDEWSAPVKSALSSEIPLNLKASLKLATRTLKNLHVGSFHDYQLGNLLAIRYTNRSTFGDARLLRVNAILNCLENEAGKLFDATYAVPTSDPSLKIVTALWLNNKAIPALQLGRHSSMGASIGFNKSYIGRHFHGSVGGALSEVQRSVLEVKDSANDEIKTYAGDNIKRSVTFNADASNLSYLPSSKGALALSGIRASLKGELAAFLSAEHAPTSGSKLTDRFNKVELQTQLLRSFFWNNVTFDSEFKVGNITNLTPGSQTLHVQDKFFVSLPGYRTLGYDKNAPKIGGLSYASYRVSLFWRFFFCNKTHPLRAFASVTGARLSQSPQELVDVSSYNKDFSTTASLGMLYKVGDSASCSLGYNWPLNNKDPDATKPGLDLSISLYGDY